MWLQPDEVVEEAMRDLLGGKAVSIPSRRYRVLTSVSRLMPRAVVAKIARRGR